MKRRAAFRQADLTRALKAAKNAGVEIASIRVEPDGTIHIVAGGPEPAATNDLDRWLAVHANSSQGNSFKP